MKIAVALDWLPNTNHTGLYVARERGWYGDLSVSFISPHLDGYKATPGSRCRSGEAQFAVHLPWAACLRVSGVRTLARQAASAGRAQRDGHQQRHPGRRQPPGRAAAGAAPLLLARAGHAAVPRTRRMRRRTAVMCAAGWGANPHMLHAGGGSATANRPVRDRDAQVQRHLPSRAAGRQGVRIVRGSARPALAPGLLARVPAVGAGAAQPSPVVLLARHWELALQAQPIPPLAGTP